MDLERVADALSRMTPVTARSPLCPRSRSNRVSCRTCLDVCPARAITLGPSINIGDCSGCGLCVVRCPAGVFEVQRPSDGALVSAVRERAAESGDVVLGCGRHRDRRPVHSLEVNCLGRISPELLVALVAAGARRIVLLWDPDACAACGYQALQESVETAVSRAAHFLAAAGMGTRTIVMTARWEEALAAPQRHPWLFPPRRRGVRAGPAWRRNGMDVDRSRRELFASAWKETRQVPAAFLDHLLGRGGERGAAAGGVPGQTGLPPRRELLLGALEELAREHEGVAQAPVFQERLNLQCGCALCGICSRLCPTGALAQTEEGELRVLTVRPDRCTGCNLCLEVCPEKALVWAGPLTVWDLLQRAAHRLAWSGGRTCAVCGGTYHNSDEAQALCTRCRLLRRAGQN